MSLSLLVNKHNYISMPREEINGERLYITPEGDRLPSVTTILAKTTSIDKKRILERWKTSVGLKKADEIVKEAAARGTRMHKFLERYVLEGALPPPGSNPFSIQSHKMAESIINKGFVNISELWGSEINLYYPELYAGTCDSCGIYQNEPAIFDYKQSNKPKIKENIEDYFIQLALYIIAHNRLYQTNIKRGVILMCSKPLDLGKGVWGPALYQEFTITPDEFNFWETQAWNRVEQYYQLKHQPSKETN